MNPRHTRRLAVTSNSIQSHCAISRLITAKLVIFLIEREWFFPESGSSFARVKPASGQALAAMLAN